MLTTLKLNKNCPQSALSDEIQAKCDDVGSGFMCMASYKNRTAALITHLLGTVEFFIYSCLVENSG